MDEPMSATIEAVQEDTVVGADLVDPGQESCSAEPRSQEIEERHNKTEEACAALPDVREQGELKAIVEALLFVSHEPLPVVRLVSLLGSVTKSEIEQTLRQLGTDLDQQGRGLQLVEVAGGYRMVTRQDYAPWIKRLDKTRSAPKLSRSALESLAIIAYKQPVVRGEIEQIRGVETSGVLRTLLERKLVRMVGRKDVPGRPIMYGTTKFFLEHFGLRDLSGLPPLRELKELGEAEQTFLPIDEDAIAMDTSEPFATDDSPAQQEFNVRRDEASAQSETEDSQSPEPVEQT